ncbi:MAG TPA: phospholipase D-like domain-containing protein [Usitatibacter sp.]|nr:phospholipase D-like domain-containing protein [Usitatibacter sp.]
MRPRASPVLFLSAAIGAASACIGVPAAEAKADTPPRAHVEVAFSPAEDVAGLIVSRIAAANASVLMQAYLLTDRRIANALLAARKRGVEVELIGDAAQQASGGLPHLKALVRAGVRVYLDSSHGAAHNKIVILDGEGAGATVITGSYNFTRAAQRSNAENVVVLSGNRAVTDRFVANFRRQRQSSTPWPSTSTSHR